MTKARAWELLAGLSRGVVWFLLRVLPVRHHAVVYGWPDNEANAIEVVRVLRRRYRGRVYWLLDDVGYRAPAFAAAELDGSDRVVRVKKNSRCGVWRSLTAELTVFTHGLYTAVNAPSNRLVVNVWHGDGPKVSYDTDLVRSTVVVAGSTLWGRYKAEIFGVPDDSLAVVGNPRSDELFEPLLEQQLNELGLSAARRRVLWMPTYRQAKGPRARAWSDGGQLSTNGEVDEVVFALAGAAARLGLDLVVKPHPLDADDYSYDGLRVVKGKDLDAAGVSLYQLIGSSDALISDVSSVWVDYMTLDRPIGFFMPDLEELTSRRGLNVDDLESILPGTRIESPAQAVDFLEAVASTGRLRPPSSYAGAARIGVPPAPGCSDRLIDWLADYQRNHHRATLFAPGPMGTGPPSSFSAGGQSRP